MMLVKCKEFDTVRYNTIVAAADPDLQFPIDADSSYLVRGQLWMRGSTAGDMRHGFWGGGATITYGAGISNTWWGSQADSVKTASGTIGAWDAAALAANTTRSVFMITGAYRLPIRFVYLFKTGAVAGTFSVTWAQYVADAVNPIKMLAGSMIQYEKLP